MKLHDRNTPLRATQLETRVVGYPIFPTPAKILRANSPSTEILTAKAHSASNRPVFTSEIYGIETTRHRGTAKPYVGARVMGKVNLVRSCCTDHVQHVHYSFDWRYSSEERTLHGPRCTTFQDCGQPGWLLQRSGRHGCPEISAV